MVILIFSMKIVIVFIFYFIFIQFAIRGLTIKIFIVVVFLKYEWAIKLTYEFFTPWLFLFAVVYFYVIWFTLR